MKVGDLVRPILCCSGQAGDIRCESAVVIAASVDRARETTRRDNVDIRCNCGVSQIHPVHLELINASRREPLAYSADPM